MKELERLVPYLGTWNAEVEIMGQKAAGRTRTFEVRGPGPDGKDAVQMRIEYAKKA